MHGNKTRMILVSILLIILLIAGGLYWRSGSAEEGEGAVATETVDTNTPNSTSGIGAFDQNGNPVSITPVEINDSAIPAPSLTRSVKIPASFPAEAAASLRKKIEETVTSLKTSPTNELWVNLAVYRSTIEDYQGARDIWEYLVKLYPEQAVFYGNLGNLYHLHLKEYLKSESNFKKAIGLEAGNSNWYRGLFDLYRYSYKQATSAAEDILKEGIREIPDSIELRVLLAQYYKEENRNVEAKTTYEGALAVADRLGDSNMITIIKNELKAF